MFSIVVNLTKLHKCFCSVPDLEVLRLFSQTAYYYDTIIILFTMKYTFSFSTVLVQNIVPNFTSSRIHKYCSKSNKMH